MRAMDMRGKCGRSKDTTTPTWMLILTGRLVITDSGPSQVKYGSSLMLSLTTRQTMRCQVRLLSQNLIPSHRIRSQSKQKRRSEEHTSELQSRENLVCRLLL